MNKDNLETNRVFNESRMVNLLEEVLCMALAPRRRSLKRGESQRNANGTTVKRCIAISLRLGRRSTTISAIPPALPREERFCGRGSEFHSDLDSSQRQEFEDWFERRYSTPSQDRIIDIEVFR